MPYADQFLALANHLETIIAQGGYLILGLFTLLEGLPVIGMVVPGHAAIIAAGFLARVGTLDLLTVIIIAVCGAVVGDYTGFWLGRKYGMAFIERIRPNLLVKDAHIDKARDLLARHTGKTMILGRFTPATRALMPFLVGASHTSTAKFWFFNLLGGICWATSSILLGYIFGAGYSAAANYAGRFILGGIIIALIIVWGYRFINTRYHVFRRYELFTLILNIFALLVLVFMFQDAASAQPFMVKFDVWVSTFMNAHNNGSALNSILASLAEFISKAGSTVVMGILALIFSAVMYSQKRWRSFAVMVLSVGATAMIVGLLKHFFLRSRPEFALETLINDPSFPSGHASLSAAFFTAFVYLIAPKIHSRNKREGVFVIAVLAVMAIGISRLVLNVHWASDVIAGWALGLFIATASILLVRYANALVFPKQNNYFIV